MFRIVTLLAVMSVAFSATSVADERSHATASVLLAAMAEGIGDLTFASAEWVETAGAALSAAATRHAEGLQDLGQFTLCEVAHNPPAYLHGGATLAWYVQFNGSAVVARTGEPEHCDLKIEGDHSIMSNLARIEHHGNDPRIVAAALARLQRLSHWEVEGSVPTHEVLAAVLQAGHDAMAIRTMPRLVFMTPEWVSIARHILATRAISEQYAAGIRDLVYTFAEEFTDTPRYAFPDGSHGGFWLHANHGQVTIGAGPLPEELQPADHLTLGLYTPVVPVGRTVAAAMTEADKVEQGAYSVAAFRRDEKTNQQPVSQTSPSGKGPLPAALGSVMATLHDELSKRTSGELPSDFDATIKRSWATPQKFDRNPAYDPSWVLYDQFDIYGEPINP